MADKTSETKDMKDAKAAGSAGEAKRDDAATGAPQAQAAEAAPASVPAAPPPGSLAEAVMLMGGDNSPPPAPALEDSNAVAAAHRATLPAKVGISTCHGGEMVHPFYGDGKLRFTSEAVLVPKAAVDAWLLSQVQAGKLRIE